MSSDASIDRLIETGQISYDDANRLREGDDRKEVVRGAGAAAVRSFVRKPRRSRRGGRAFLEPS